MGKIITMAAIKGGCGKTVTAAALAQAAAADGKRVLAVDLDPQCTLSIWHGADLRRPGSYDIIARGMDAAAQETESGVAVICGSANLSAVKTSPGSARRLEKALDPVRPVYDLIIIDTGPAMGELQNNALFASDGLMIPLEADAASLQGYYQIMDIARMIRREKPSLQILGVCVTKYDARPKINRTLRQAIEDRAAADNVPYLGEIRQGIAIREAAALQASIYSYAPQSNPARDYRRIYYNTFGRRGEHGEEF